MSTPSENRNYLNPYTIGALIDSGPLISFEYLRFSEAKFMAGGARELSFCG